jgi:MFS family permease
MTVALPALNCLQRGQVSIAVLYMMLLGLRWIVESRTSAAIFFGGMLISMSVAIKIVPMLPIAFFLFIQWINDLRQRWQSSDVAALLGRRWAAATAGTIFGLVLFFLLIPAALIGWRANVQHLNTWAQLVLVSASDSTATPGFEKDTHSVRNQCLGNALYRLGNFGEYVLAGGPEDPLVDDDHPPPRMMDAASVNTCLFFVRIAILCTLMLVGFRLSQSNDARLAQVTGFGLACAAMLVLSPVARNHYFVLFTPAALFVPFWFHRMGHRFFAVWMAVVPCVLILLQYVLMPYVGRIGLLGLGMTGWLMASMVVMERISRGAIVSATGASMEPSKIFLPNAA